MISDLTTNREEGAELLELPSPTFWPFVMAFGITIGFGGLVTSESVSGLGALLAIAGAVGWFRNVLPHEAHEAVVIVSGQDVIATSRPEVARVLTEQQPQRAWLPVETYPVSAGIKGGLIGSVVMAGLAMLYGLISHTSVWYPINLLVAGFFPGAANAATAQITEFHLFSLLIAIPIH